MSDQSPISVQILMWDSSHTLSGHFSIYIVISPELDDVTAVVLDPSWAYQCNVACTFHHVLFNFTYWPKTNQLLHVA